MDNKKHSKNLVTIRIVATILILLSLILPYFGLIAHITTPFLIFITLFVFYVVESGYRKKTEHE